MRLDGVGLGCPAGQQQGPGHFPFVPAKMGAHQQAERVIGIDVEGLLQGFLGFFHFLVQP